MISLSHKNWEVAKLGDLCEISIGKTPARDQLENFGCGYTWLTIADFKGDKFLLESKEEITDEALERANHKLVTAGTVLLTFKLTIGKVAIAGKDLYTNEAIAAFTIKDKNILLDEYLYIALQAIDYSSKTDKAVKGETLNKAKLKDLTIALPPIQAQKEVIALFEKVDNLTMQISKQGDEIKGIWKGLINGLTNQSPFFGKLLNKKSLKKVRYCDVVEKIARRTDPIADGIKRIVAGENIGSEDLKIRSWQTVGDCYLGPAFHMRFVPGDILYGSRRTYLKKVALADFEGVCANTTYVLRSKQEVLMQDYLKHIMLSENFTNYSISVSKGSTNPYINWKDLDDYTFYIPEIDIQYKIANALDQILENLELNLNFKNVMAKFKNKLLHKIFND